MEFSWYRVLAVMKKNLTALKRDRRTIGLIIFLPIMMMLVFGYAFGTDIRNVKVVICNLDANAGSAVLSNKGYSFLAGDDRLELTDNVTTVAAGLDEVHFPGLLPGVWALIVFPVNFTEKWPHPAPVEMYVDGSNPQIVAAVVGAVTTMLVDLSGNASVVLYNVTYKYGNKDYRPVDSMSPGILGFTVMIFMLLLSIVFNVRERLSGMTERMTATPTRKIEVVLGNLLGYSLIAVLQTSLLLLIVKLIFNIAIVGEVLYVFLMLFIFAINTLSLGLFLSAFAKNEQQAFQFIPLMIIPSVLLSGFVFPIDGFPDFLKVVSYLLPMTYIIIILRKDMLAGLGLQSVWLEFLVLAGMTILFLLLAAIVYNRQKR
jgi:ABC-2 type transport system permease protein